MSESAYQRILVTDSDDDESDFFSGAAPGSASQLPSPIPKRPSRSDTSTNRTGKAPVRAHGHVEAPCVFSPVAVACAESLLKQQAVARTAHERLSLLRQVGHLGGAYGECVKGAPGYSMWLRYVHANQDIIAKTAAFLAKVSDGSDTITHDVAVRRTQHHTKSVFTLNNRSHVVGCCRPLPFGRQARSLSSVRSTTPGATGSAEESSGANGANAYELSQGERCALSLFAMHQSDACDAEPVRGRAAAHAGHFSDHAGMTSMAPSNIYEGSSVLAAPRSIERLKRPRTSDCSPSIESLASTSPDGVVAPSLCGTVIETQLIKSQREWLECSQAASLCPYYY